MSANNYVDRPLAMFEENSKIQSLSESKSFANLRELFLKLQRDSLVVVSQSFATSDDWQECRDKYKNESGRNQYDFINICVKGRGENEKRKQITNSIDQLIDSLLVIDVENTKTVNALEVEKQELQAALSEAQDANSKPSVQVFPFVNWARANGSKAWYKDVDWSSIPFVHLSSDEKSSLDWSKINYKEAVQSETFDFDLIDWSDIKAASKGVAAKVYKSIDWAQFDFSTLDAAESALVDWTKVNFVQAQNSDTFDLTDLEWSAINGLDAKSKKKVYGKINWGKVDYNDISSDANSAFDWAHVNFKKAFSTSNFSLDAVDIDEAKNSKNFKKLSATLKKSSSDALLAAASDATLQEIGYENFSSKLSDSLRKEFSTDSGEYALIMKPYSYARASAVAKAMGGQLASIDNSDNGFVDKLTGILEDKSVSKKLFQTTKDNTSLAWFSDHVGEDNTAFNAMKLENLSNINNVSADPSNEHWFLVEMPIIGSGSTDITVV
mgnify:CR=1 FL=1